VADHFVIGYIFALAITTSLLELICVGMK
jgi:hypothetical protein